MSRLKEIRQGWPQSEFLLRHELEPEARACRCMLSWWVCRHREGRALDILRDTWAAHEGTVCRGINWERQPLEELATIADCVGGAGLAALCLLLAQDHSGWGGAPAALFSSVGK